MLETDNSAGASEAPTHATAKHRVLDGIREIGVLLIAFTPLDYAAFAASVLVEMRIKQ